MKAVDIDQTCKARQMLPNRFAAIETNRFMGADIGKLHHPLFRHHVDEAVGSGDEIITQSRPQQGGETGHLVWTCGGDLQATVDTKLFNDAAGGLLYWRLIITRERADRGYIDGLVQFIIAGLLPAAK
ncbi:MAG: hypothetical protein WBA73_11900 [Devosia sp.]